MNKGSEVLCNLVYISSSKHPKDIENKTPGYELNGFQHLTNTPSVYNISIQIKDYYSTY